MAIHGTFRYVHVLEDPRRLNQWRTPGEITCLVRTSTVKLTMKTLVYRGPGSISVEERPRPKLEQAHDAVLKNDQDDDLRHGPSHSERGRSDLYSGQGSRARRHRSNRGARGRGFTVQKGRPRHRILHHVMR